jgi:hypothetical protein
VRDSKKPEIRARKITIGGKKKVRKNDEEKQS